MLHGVAILVINLAPPHYAVFATTLLYALFRDTAYAYAVSAAFLGLYSIDLAIFTAVRVCARVFASVALGLCDPAGAALLLLGFLLWSPLSPLHAITHAAAFPALAALFNSRDIAVASLSSSNRTSTSENSDLGKSASLGLNTATASSASVVSGKSGIFDLSHVLLNFDLDHSQWGNLGLWPVSDAVSDSDADPDSASAATAATATPPPPLSASVPGAVTYAAACASLASAVFAAAAVAAPDRVLSVGFGCGD